MGKITLNEALKKASVKNDLQMFLGLDAQSELGGMTPERLAAVAGGLKKRIDVALGAKKMIAEGCGLLLIQVPYVDIAISAFIISPSKITVLNDDSKTAPKIKVEGTKVYYTESREGSNQIYTCSFLTKGTFYEQV